MLAAGRYRESEQDAEKAPQGHASRPHGVGTVTIWKFTLAGTVTV